MEVTSIFKTHSNVASGCPLTNLPEELVAVLPFAPSNTVWSVHLPWHLQLVAQWFEQSTPHADEDTITSSSALERSSRQSLQPETRVVKSSFILVKTSVSGAISLAAAGERVLWCANAIIVLTLADLCSLQRDYKFLWFSLWCELLHWMQSSWFYTVCVVPGQWHSLGACWVGCSALPCFPPTHTRLPPWQANSNIVFWLLAMIHSLYEC